MGDMYRKKASHLLSCFPSVERQERGFIHCLLPPWSDWAAYRTSLCLPMTIYLPDPIKGSPMAGWQPELPRPSKSLQTGIISAGSAQRYKNLSSSDEMLPHPTGTCQESEAFRTASPMAYLGPGVHSGFLSYQFARSNSLAESLGAWLAKPVGKSHQIRKSLSFILSAHHFATCCILWYPGVLVSFSSL